jgi:pteridine reductase
VIAHSLAGRGYQIALHYHSSETAAFESRDQLRELGVRCEAFQADVASDDAVKAMVDQIKETFGRIDVLVTTASIWDEDSLDDVSEDALRRNFDINTLGTFFAARAAGRLMVDQPSGGAIITIGDWAIERPYLDHVAYFISKGALPTLTRMLARELGSRNPNIRVNCIHPGPVMFPPDASEERKSRLVEATVVKKADCPEMVAKAVLAFIDNTFVTGVCMPVDGGRHMYSPDEV